MVDALRTIGAVQPSPQQSPERFLGLLRERYAAMADGFRRFVAGLAVPPPGFEASLRDLPDRACRVYEESFRQLVVDFPEVACWAGQREHRATRAALAGLEETLLAISGGRAPDERRRSLAGANRAELGKRVAEPGDSSGGGFDLPTLGDAYVAPLFRAADVPPSG